jgi:hypothetical protein
MTAVEVPAAAQRALTDAAVRQLPNATKSKAQVGTITPELTDLQAGAEAGGGPPSGTMSSQDIDPYTAGRAGLPG